MQLESLNKGEKGKINIQNTCKTAVIERPGCNYVNIAQLIKEGVYLEPEIKSNLDKVFILYRALSIMLFNFAQSGHPGGSISAGRMFISTFLKGGMKYDISLPWRKDADMPVIAAGHKAMGWYSWLSILFEAVKQEQPDLLPPEEKYLRLEDLLGFRKNKSVITTLRKNFHSKTLDGHPTPETPFTHLVTGASGVGVTTSVGLAFGAGDIYRNMPPNIFTFEGEGGMTPGRVEEALMIAGRGQLGNYILLVDHNDASIDVCDLCHGAYSSITPEERGIIHGFETILIENGKDFNQIIAAFDYLNKYLLNSNKPKMIVFRTEKGEGYGYGTNKSHGAGWKMDEPSYFEAQKIFEETFGIKLEKIPADANTEVIEEYFWKSIQTIRQALEKDDKLRKFIVENVILAKEELNKRNSERPEIKTTFINKLFSLNPLSTPPPESLQLKPGNKMALRESLAITLGELNKISNEGFFFAAADLFGSLALDKAVPKIYHSAQNMDARVIAGGITEDGLSGVMAGISAYGSHIGVLGSYAAFLTSMGWTASRLHAIGHDVTERSQLNPLILITGHAGPKTGEDGPTHACPQALSAWASFPKGLVITLTPWDNTEVWPLMLSALSQNKRPAVIAAFVTRPSETIINRIQLGFAPAVHSISGVYALRKPDPSKKCHGYIILQGSAVMYELVNVIQEIDTEGFNLGYYYISSRELFELLPQDEQDEIWNDEMSNNAMGITDFTIDTMEKWVTSAKGRKLSLYPFQGGHFLGSGKGYEVLKQGGLDSEAIKKRILEFAGN